MVVSDLLCDPPAADIALPAVTLAAVDPPTPKGRLSHEAVRLVTGGHLQDTPVLHDSDILLPGLADKVTWDLVTRALVEHRA
eukprot:15463214-Alexandrium_andersonii.AAC.1